MSAGEDASADVSVGDAGTPDVDATIGEASAPGIDAAACNEPPPSMPAPTVDLTLCSPYPNLDKNRPLGSGLNPDLFPDGITCDPATLFCVLTREPGR
jgi:hypothetical protein